MKNRYKFDIEAEKAFNERGRLVIDTVLSTVTAMAFVALVWLLHFV
jgi:hypothetical protein